MIEFLMTVCIGLLVLLLIILNVFMFRMLKMVIDEYMEDRRFQKTLRRDMKAERSNLEDDRYL